MCTLCFISLGTLVHLCTNAKICASMAKFIHVHIPRHISYYYMYIMCTVIIFIFYICVHFHLGSQWCSSLGCLMSLSSLKPFKRSLQNTSPMAYHHWKQVHAHTLTYMYCTHSHTCTLMQSHTDTLIPDAIHMCTHVLVAMSLCHSCGICNVHVQCMPLSPPTTVQLATTLTSGPLLDLDTSSNCHCWGY